MLSKKRLLVGAFLSSVGILMVAYALDAYSAAGLYFLAFFPGVILTIFGIALAFSPDPNQYIVAEEVEVDPDLQVGNEPRVGEGNSYLYTSVGDPFMGEYARDLLSRDQPFHEQRRKR